MTQAQAMEPAAPTPAGEGHPGAGPAAAGPSAGGQDDGFVRFPREQLAPWGGDTHKLVEHGKAYGQLEADGWIDVAKEMSRSGITGRQFLGYMTGGNPEDLLSGQLPADAAPPQTPGAPPQTPPGLPSLDAITAAVGDRLNAFRDEIRKEQEEAAKRAEETRLEQQRTEARTRFGMSSLESIGIKSDAENLEQRGRIPWWVAQAALDRAVEESIPAHIQGEMREKMAAQPPTQAHVARATEFFKADWADHENEIEAAIAQRQKDTAVPAATLGEGAGGRSGENIPTTRKGLLEAMIAEPPGQ